MICDDNAKLLAETAITSAITGTGVSLDSIYELGYADPIPIHMYCSVAGVGGTSITVKLQQCDTDTAASYTDVESITIPIASLTEGAKIGWRFLPDTVTKKWIRLVTTNTGTFTAGKIGCEIGREDLVNWRDSIKFDKGRLSN